MPHVYPTDSGAYTRDGRFVIEKIDGWKVSNGVVIAEKEPHVPGEWYFRLTYPDDGDLLRPEDTGCRVSMKHWCCKIGNEYIELGLPTWMTPARISDHS